MLRFLNNPLYLNFITINYNLLLILIQTYRKLKLFNHPL